MNPLDQLLASAKDGPSRMLDVKGIDLSFVALGDVQAERLQGSALLAKGSSWRGCLLDMPVLDGACFVAAVMDDSRLVEAALGGADFSSASLRNVLWFASLAPEARFDGADLSGATLDGGVFTGSSFRGARLAGASLVRCSFRDRDLTEADFSGADLEHAIFDGATMMRTVFDGETPSS